MKYRESKSIDLTPAATRSAVLMRTALAAFLLLCAAPTVIADSGDFYRTKVVASTGTPDEKGRTKVKFKRTEAEIKQRVDSATVVLRYPVLQHMSLPNFTNADAMNILVQFRDNGGDAQVIARLISVDDAGNASTHLIMNSDDYSRSDDFQWGDRGEQPSASRLDDRTWFVEVTLKKTGPNGRPACRLIEVYAREE